MNNSQKIERLNDFKYIQDPLEKLIKIDFSLKEMVDLLKDSINKNDWLKVAKCITWIQQNPNIAYIDSLCSLLVNHFHEFHPEEVIDTLDEILEISQSNDKLGKISEALSRICCLIHEDDPNFNINIKCILLLSSIASLGHDFSQIAINGLIKASKCDNPQISDEADECLNELNTEDRNNWL